MHQTVTPIQTILRIVPINKVAVEETHSLIPYRILVEALNDKEAHFTSKQQIMKKIYIVAMNCHIMIQF